MFKCCLVVLALGLLSHSSSAHTTGYQLPVPRATTSTGRPQTRSAQPSQYEKTFYFFQAPPEEDITKTPAFQRALQMVKKNVQVIFIKTPENKGFEDAVLQLLKSYAEQKTHIYVLNKQPDIDGLARKFQALRQQTNNKPEVHFVKYRTPEEAHNAQQQIRNQYANSRGAAKDHGSAIAQTLNFATNRQTISGQAGNSDSRPVDKNYAINHLPAGIDVKPGTSYIPLTIRH